MTKRDLRELIRATIKEYTGTGAGGRNHPKGGGNLQTSPRPFADDKDELENYTNKNVYGGDGKHYRNEPVLPNPNRTKMTKF
tara:strand:+ start:494 stop:739 length:246 start_codon:yes stop_codon:yes gene_type:complete